MNVLKNKTAVITGSTRGFGYAVAQAYIQAGAQVVISSRSAEAVNRAVARLRASGAQVSGYPCDVADRQQVEALAKHTDSVFGGLDIWVNNAGLSAPYGPTAHVPVEDFVRVTQTNILGTYYGSITPLERFLERGQGKLINILGRGDRGPQPMQTAYASSKSWIHNFTRSLAKEYKDSGVGIFAFNPGMMKTEMLQDLDVVEGNQEALKIMPTILRMWAVDPVIPAQKMVWLASSATDGRTGLVRRQMSVGGMLAGAAREAWRRLTGKEGEAIPLNVRIVPPAISIPSNNPHKNQSDS